ncbi:MAG: hypothetical protein JO265_05995 [Acidimicrobiia bacterium]|nr:hypothetical protein [Acidimicrobiia bacterium]
MATQRKTGTASTRSGRGSKSANGSNGSNSDSNGALRVRVPIVNFTISLPSPAPKLAYYAGLGAMAALEFIEWPVALVIAAGHEVATRTRNPDVEEAAEGVESGA